MTINLQNDRIALELEPDQGTFSIHPRDIDLPEVLNAQLYLSYNRKKERVVNRLKAWNDEKGMKIWSDEKQDPQQIEMAEHGRIETIKFMVSPDKHGIACNLTFGVMKDHPLVIWKLEVVNSSTEAISIQAIDLLDLDPHQSGALNWSTPQEEQDLGFFSNGWQSWSPSRWYGAEERMASSKLGILQLPMIKNHDTPLPKKNGQFSSDFFAIIGDSTARTGILFGSLSQKDHFTSIFSDFTNSVSVRMWANGDNARLDPGCSMSTDWAVFSLVKLDDPDPLKDFLEAVARENQIKITPQSPVGWCSWYHFYTHISEPIIQDNIKAIIDQRPNLPIDLVQIDDGFESQIGDWFTFKPEFPNGVKPLASEIKRQGLIPGLWLAPFILHPQAKIVRQHPDWLLRKRNGKPANTGYVWGSLGYALDLTVPEALDYACRVVKTASEDWGFPYLKLDFLYAAAVECRYHDRTLTRAQVMRMGMEAIRAAVGPDVTLLGCGAPLGSMLGLVEAMRIGADVSPDWVPSFNGIKLFIKEEPSFPCARNSMRNILTRANLHRQWWINDPDCLLIRPDSHLSLTEIKSLASAIALTGGSLLVSDDLPQLSQERLRLAECLLPVIDKRAQVMDWCDTGMPAKLRLDLSNETGEWYVLAKFNWNDQEADLSLSADEYHLSAADYWVSEFWSGSLVIVRSGEEAKFQNVPAHGCVVTAWRKTQTETLIYLGSDLHISQGIEVSEWKVSRKEIKVKLNLSRKTSGKIKLFIPGSIESVWVNDFEVENVSDSIGVRTILVEMDGDRLILINKKK